jgi:hypothetical protein
MSVALGAMGLAVERLDCCESQHHQARNKFAVAPDVTSTAARQRNSERVSQCEFRLTKYVKKHGLKEPFG